jgi:hypothetical protein
VRKTEIRFSARERIPHFATVLIAALEPTQSRIFLLPRALSPCIRRPEFYAHNATPHNAEVKDMSTFTFTLAGQHDVVFKHREYWIIFEDILPI